MNAYVLTGDSSQSEEFTKKVIFDNKIASYNTHRYNKKVKIADVRDIQKILSQKLGTREYRAIIFTEAITQDAQHALLKTLEEVEAHTFFIIQAKTREALLPTILSRSFIRDFSDNKSTGGRYMEFLSRLFSLRTDESRYISHLYSQSEKIVDADNAFPELIFDSRSSLLAAVTEHNAEKIAFFYLILSKLSLYTPLVEKNNINKRIVVENVFFDFV